MMLGRLLTTLISLSLIMGGFALCGVTANEGVWFFGFVFVLIGMLLFAKMVDVERRGNDRVSGED